MVGGCGVNKYGARGGPRESGDHRHLILSGNRRRKYIIIACSSFSSSICLRLLRAYIMPLVWKRQADLKEKLDRKSILGMLAWEITWRRSSGTSTRNEISVVVVSRVGVERQGGMWGGRMVCNVSNGGAERMLIGMFHSYYSTISANATPPQLNRIFAKKQGLCCNSGGGRKLYIYLGEYNRTWHDQRSASVSIGNNLHM